VCRVRYLCRHPGPAPALGRADGERLAEGAGKIGAHCGPAAILPIGILEKADNPAEGKAWRAWVPLVIFPVISCRLLLRLMQCLIAQARRNRLDFWSRG